MPEVTLSYKNSCHNRYTKTKHAEFTAEYGRIGNKLTDLQLGMDIKQALLQIVGGDKLIIPFC
ncbi:hypothetical protein [Providencia sp. CRPN13872]